MALAITLLEETYLKLGGILFAENIVYKPFDSNTFEEKTNTAKNKAKNVFNLPLFFLEPLLAAVFFELSALFSLDSLARSAGAGLSEDKTPETPPALSPLTELVSEPVLDVEVEAFLDSGCQRAGKVDHQVPTLI